MAEDKSDIRAEKAKEVSDALKESIALGSEESKQLKQKVKDLDKILSKQEDINAKIKVSNDYFNEYKSLSSEIFKTEVERDKLAKKIEEHQNKHAGVLTDVAKKQLKLVDALQNEKTEVAKLSEKRSEILRAVQSGLDIESDQVKKLQQEASIQQTIADSAMARVSAARDALTDEELMYLALESSLDAHNQSLEALKQKDSLQREINQKMGVSGALVKGLAGLLSKVGLEKHLNMDLVLAKMREAAYKGGPLKAMLTGVTEIGTALKLALSDPLVQIALLYKAFKSLVTSALDYQNRLFESAKALGLNVNETEKLVVNFRMMAASNSQMGLTSAEMVKYYGEMASALGIMVNENAEFMTQSTAITRNLGITAEQFQTVQLLAKESGKSVKDAFASIVGTAKAQGARLKIAMTERQVMEAVGKVSATVFNNFRGSVSQLTKAVVTATKFGTTLDQINQAGMQLLDFESSISKEFEAQLLTGKQMDLTMARQYALTGETEKLMHEITNQLGSQDGWNNMNVLKQQSLAESLGMSKEAVDEIFKKQALINALGPAASKNLEEQYKYLLEREGSHAKVVELMGQESAERALQASAQTQLNAAVAELKDSFAAIGNALFPITATIGALARGISKITQESKTMLNILKGMLSLYLGIKIVQIAINAQRAISLALIKAQRKQETKNTGLSIVGAMAGLIGKGGIPGLLIAGAVAAGLFALMSKYGEGGDSVGSMVTPPSLEGGEKQISPMNQATATAKANSANSDKVSGTPRVFVNITDNSKFDPVKPNQVRDFSYNIVSSDGVAGAMGR